MISQNMSKENVEQARTARTAKQVPLQPVTTKVYSTAKAVHGRTSTKLTEGAKHLRLRPR